jgi:signal transduction histidine kinase
VLPFIFDPFFTTKKTTGGTGIGLSNVRQIVEQWGGRIEATNTVDLGAQFTLRLPMA